MPKAKRVPESPAVPAVEPPAVEPPAGGLPAGGLPAELPEYLTQDLALAYIRAKGVPVADSFFRDQRNRRKGPPARYFGPRAMYKRDELDAWLPSIFRSKTWDRRSSKGVKAMLKAKAAKARARARARAAVPGETHIE